MRIAFITSEYVTESNFDGGLANYLSRICRALRNIGHNPMIIVGTSSDGYIEDDGIPVYRTNFENALMHFLRKRIPVLRIFTPALIWAWESWLLNKRIHELNKKEKIDITQYTSVRATSFIRNKSIPSVVRVSSLYGDYNRAYGGIKSLQSSLLEYIETSSIRNGDRIICPSGKVAQSVRLSTGRDVTVIESPYLPNHTKVDLQPFHDLLKNKNYLLFYGSIGLLKGVKTIAETLPAILGSYKDLFFVFIGKDMGFQSNTMMNYVWEKAGSFRGRALYLGAMQHSQLMPIIQGAKAVVLPSLIDNLPNACIEAMAQGKIVIGTRGASFDQLIENGISGILCNIDDPEDLFSAIKKALELDQEQRQSMALNAEERIKALKPGIIAEQLIDVYNDAIQSHRESYLG